jgi:N-acetylglutamate synthase-like GNAT family acetyltransferase
MIEIRRAEGTDHTAIEQLLVSNDLPLDGLDAALPLALVAVDGGRLVGCGAIEARGASGLLRSVCVEAGVRGTGTGRRLVEELENLALASGINDIYLLTETAGSWFPRFGYEAADRSEVPAAMAASAEFMTACPVSALLLRKSLAVSAR